ncbi:hypothetical protein [Methylorubrum zatmanii]|uniref:Uncharacterized protein n=1 Tax=Methylorubrum zatmanii TaxID=29429 RepID=A0ABW1WXE5_9HYPH|nr:hypothetical protein [Methylorubrum zatmanii]
MEGPPGGQIDLPFPMDAVPGPVRSPRGGWIDAEAAGFRLVPSGSWFVLSSLARAAKPIRRDNAEAAGRPQLHFLSGINQKWDALAIGRSGCNPVALQCSASQRGHLRRRNKA